MILPQDSNKTRINPEKLAHQYNNMYNHRNLDGILSLFDQSGCFVWGTGKDEERKGLKELKSQFQRDWSQSEKSSLAMESIHIFEQDSVAWVIAELKPTVTIQGKLFQFENIRTTYIMLKKDNEWKITHAHWSWPSPLQEAGESYPLKST